MTRFIDTLSELDAVLDHAVKLRETGDDAFRSALSAVTLRPKQLLDSSNRDPLSADFRAAQLRFYEALSNSGYDVAREETGMSEARLRKLLDPAALTRGGVKGAAGGG